MNAQMLFEVSTRTYPDKDNPGKMKQVINCVEVLPNPGTEFSLDGVVLENGTYKGEGEFFVSRLPGGGAIWKFRPTKIDPLDIRSMLARLAAQPASNKA